MRDNFDERISEVLKAVEETAQRLYQTSEPNGKDDGQQVELIQGVLAALLSPLTNGRCGDQCCENTDPCNKHKCKNETYQVEFDIPADSCIVSATIAQNGIREHSECGMCWVTASFTVYLTYKVCDQYETTVSKQSAVVFTCVPEWASSDYTLYLPNCPKVSKCCGQVTVRGNATLCY